MLELILVLIKWRAFETGAFVVLMKKNGLYQKKFTILPFTIPTYAIFTMSEFNWKSLTNSFLKLKGISGRSFDSCFNEIHGKNISKKCLFLADAYLNDPDVRNRNFEAMQTIRGNFVMCECLVDIFFSADFVNLIYFTSKKENLFIRFLTDETRLFSLTFFLTWVWMRRYNM